MERGRKASERLLIAMTRGGLGIEEVQTLKQGGGVAVEVLVKLADDECVGAGGQGSGKVIGGYQPVEQRAQEGEPGGRKERRHASV